MKRLRVLAAKTADRLILLASGLLRTKGASSFLCAQNVTTMTWKYGSLYDLVLVHKGPYINDVTNVGSFILGQSGIFFVSTKFMLSPFLWSEFG